jgi:two-component system cell cycle sensor histidine kinase/response regulator CckA
MEAVGQLTGGIAHDFNNLLTAVLGSLELLRKRLPNDPKAVALLENAAQGAQRGATLTKRMLAFARNYELKQEVIAIPELVHGMTELLQRSVGPTYVIETRFPLVLKSIEADPNQLELAILNLSLNARDAMPDGGEIILAAREENIASGHPSGLGAGRYIRLSVTDAGEGMDDETLSRATEPFFTTKDVGKGTGLGLSTVYGIVKQTGGFIYADSRPGHTCFRIFLPRHTSGLEDGSGHVRALEAAAINTIAAADSLVQAANEDLTGQGTILLVEDEDGLRALNARGLSSRGYTVLEASNGLDAIEVLERAGHIDLVVSDVVMPEMDGPSLLKELRRRDATVRLIFVSGYAEEAFAKNLPSQEQYAFLAKPFTLKQLVAEVKKTLAQ